MHAHTYNYTLNTHIKNIYLCWGIYKYYILINRYYGNHCIYVLHTLYYRSGIHVSLTSIYIFFCACVFVYNFVMNLLTLYMEYAHLSL